MNVSMPASLGTQETTLDFVFFLHFPTDAKIPLHHYLQIVLCYFVEFLLRTVGILFLNSLM